MCKKIECNQSIVGYADILGMKEKIKRLKNLNDSNKLLEQIGIIIDEAKDFLGINVENNPNKKIKFFTDNIIFSWVIREDGESETINTLQYMATYQFHFSLKNFFVRGAITNGINFINEDFVFGPATVDSYELEEKEAIDPRIILSTGIVDLLKKFSSYYSHITPKHRKWIIKDQDGKYFVNYLYAVVDFMNQCKNYHEGFKLLKKHKENIEKNLREYINNHKIWNKYFWLARYNNYFCNNVLRNEYDIYNENLADFNDITDYQHCNEFDFKKAIDELIIGNDLLNNDFTLCDL